MMSHRFSVITPSYNQASYLEQTIQSVLGQVYPALEYIIVDGGSTDGSVEIIRKYEKHLAWWVSERDRGQADAVNKGFRRATGDYIGWLNSDDLYEPGALFQAAQALDADPRLGIVYGDVRSIDSQGSTFNIMRYADYGLDGLLCFKNIGQPAAFLRRTVLEQAGYLDTSYDLLLDPELWMRMAIIAPIRYVPKTWAAARVHPGAKNSARAAHYGEDAYRIIAWMQANPELAGHYHRLEKRIWAGAHRLNAFYLLDAGQPRKTLQYYWKSFLAHPPTALQDWRRIAGALLWLAGWPGVGTVYRNLRRKRYERHG